MIRGINTKNIVFLTIFCITTNFIYCNKCNKLHKYNAHFHLKAHHYDGANHHQLLAASVF